MKKRKIKILKFRKKTIALITTIDTAKIKGGTNPVSFQVPMSQAPDRNGICYEEK